MGQYHCCWCPGSLHRLVISSNMVGNLEWMCSFLPWWRFFITWAILSRNDTAWNYTSWSHYARASWGRYLSYTSQFDATSSQQGRAQQTPWLQLSAGGVHSVAIDCWLEWPVGLIHAGHAWSHPGIISKMTRRLMEFWKSLNHNFT